MSASQITCPYCGKKFPLDEAIATEIKDNIEKNKQKEYEAKLAKAIKASENKIKKAFEQEQTKELIIAQQAAKEEKENNDKLRKDFEGLSKKLTKAQIDKDNAELEARKKLSKEIENASKEVKKRADEEHRLKEAELQKQLADANKALDNAKRKAEQGSQQNQGEVAELELENELSDAFSNDIVEEIKKGTRGADVTHIVKNEHRDTCGTILYEVKNAKWQKQWVSKFKNDMANVDANIGIIVSKELPQEYGDMSNIDGSIWAVKPLLVIPLANIMRMQLINLYAASKQSKITNKEMKSVYKYLTSAEFRNQIVAILDNYKKLQDELEKERRSTIARWNRQEKAIRGVVDNTTAFYGSLSGLGAIKEIPQLEAGE
jgi:hypothetical protein